MIPHAVFFLVHLAVFLFIVWIDRKHLKTYVGIGLLAMGLDVVFEIVPIQAGIWTYHAEPFVFGISLFTWLLYVPYLALCYFAAQRMVEHG